MQSQSIVDEYENETEQLRELLNKCTNVKLRLQYDQQDAQYELPNLKAKRALMEMSG